MLEPMRSSLPAISFTLTTSTGTTSRRGLGMEHVSMTSSIHWSPWSDRRVFSWKPDVLPNKSAQVSRRDGRSDGIVPDCSRWLSAQSLSSGSFVQYPSEGDSTQKKGRWLAEWQLFNNLLLFFIVFIRAHAGYNNNFHRTICRSARSSELGWGKFLI